MTIKLRGEKILLVRHTKESINAFSPVCTHKKCEVLYVADKNRFGCKCHKSEYDIEGININGPAPKPLKKFATQFDAEKSKLAIVLSD